LLNQYLSPQEIFATPSELCDFLAIVVSMVDEKHITGTLILEGLRGYPTKTTQNYHKEIKNG
jgi:hypothetical protein